jgi:hypothetical protein
VFYTGAKTKNNAINLPFLNAAEIGWRPLQGNGIILNLS